MGSSKLTTDDAWRANLIDDPAGIGDVLKSVHRIAVLGIKPANVGGPAFYVPEDAQQRGYDIVPVPVYYPSITEILGKPVHRTLAEISPPVDMVNIFRRPEDIPQHVDDILAAKPSVVWMQLGISNDAVAESLARAGIKVVQDHCLMVELRKRGMRSGN